MDPGWSLKIRKIWLPCFSSNVFLFLAFPPYLLPAFPRHLLLAFPFPCPPHCQSSCCRVHLVLFLFLCLGHDLCLSWHSHQLHPSPCRTCRGPLPLPPPLVQPSSSFFGPVQPHLKLWDLSLSRKTCYKRYCIDEPKVPYNSKIWSNHDSGYQILHMCRHWRLHDVSGVPVFLIFLRNLHGSIFDCGIVFGFLSQWLSVLIRIRLKQWIWFCGFMHMCGIYPCTMHRSGNEWYSRDTLYVCVCVFPFPISLKVPFPSSSLTRFSTCGIPVSSLASVPLTFSCGFSTSSSGSGALP